MCDQEVIGSVQFPVAMWLYNDCMQVVHTCACATKKHNCADQLVVMLCCSQHNSRFDIALATCCRLQWSNHVWLMACEMEIDLCSIGDCCLTNYEWHHVLIYVLSDISLY